MSIKTILIAGSALTLSLFICTGAGASDVILYDNLSSPVTGGDPAAVFPTGLGPLFASFSNPAGARTLTELELNLSATNPSDGDTFTVSVWSDNSTSPGTMLWHTTVNDSILSTTPTVEDFFDRRQSQRRFPLLGRGHFRRRIGDFLLGVGFHGHRCRQ